MAHPLSAKKTNMDGKQHTPGRRGRTGNQYFDVGKVGRKTGITLKDTGLRDEYGMEPMAGIFSSPVKEASPKKGSDGTMSSEPMAVQDSSAPDVDETLHLRKTPRLPPPRASTPRHTNIGSPKRPSTGRPSSRAPEPMASEASPGTSHAPANRTLDFHKHKGVRMSIEDGSPFKPKRVLRRSVGMAPARPDPFTVVPTSPPAAPAEEEDVKPVVVDTQESEAEDEQEEEAAAGEKTVQSIEQRQLDEQLADEVPLIGNDDSYSALPGAEDGDEEIEEALAQAEETLAVSPSTKPAERKGRGRPRKSGDSINTSHVQHTPPTAQMVSSSSGSKKRDRTAVETTEINDNDQSVSQMSASAGPSAKRQRGRPRRGDISVHQDASEQTIDPALLGNEDSYTAPVFGGDSEADEEDRSLRSTHSPSAQPAPQRKKPTKKAAAKKPRAPKDRDPNQSIRVPTRSPSRSTSKDAFPRSPSKRANSVSNVNLRASTPFEDSHNRVSRSGRPILKPLKHWAGESYVWKNGEVEGIIRADEVKYANPKKGGAGKKGKAAKRKVAARAGSLEIIGEEEESETESTVPDEWEESVGVIAGTVAAWDPETQQGNPDETVREDLAFASSSILTREVAGSSFQYAKIMTLPFFGSGVVEVPPQGFKRAKNSRKMQMVFFVHEGKVLVTVGPPALMENGRARSDGETETNEFAVSKGGVWVVPRGNNYSITNESRTRTSRIFFAQGCEIEAEGALTQ